MRCAVPLYFIPAYFIPAGISRTTKGQCAAA
jgi:hypothetical protein